MQRKSAVPTLLLCLLVMVLFPGGAVYAGNGQLPEPGITPDSPFYFIDTISENIGMFFTFGPEAKARKALQYAEERLAEANIMAERNQLQAMEQATHGYDTFMRMVGEKLEEAQIEGISANVSADVATAMSRHFTVIDSLHDRFPSEAKTAITRAREVALSGQKNALMVLAAVDTERALKINMKAIEDHLKRARMRANESMTADVEKALDHAARLSVLETELATAAAANSANVTAIERRLTQAAANRIAVLSDIYETVPGTLRPAVETATADSVQRYENAAEELGDTPVAGIPDKETMVQRIPLELRERLHLVPEEQPEQSPVRTANKETHYIELRASENATTEIKSPDGRWQHSP